MPYKHTDYQTFAQAEVGVVESNVMHFDHQITVLAGTATAGTVTIKAKPFGTDSGFETVYDEVGAPQSFDLTVQESVTIKGCCQSFQFTPSGANGTYKVAVVDQGV